MQRAEYEYRGLVARSWDFLRGDPLEFPDRRFYFNLIERYGEPILDVGCGTGRLLLELRQRGVDADGLDSSPEMLALCRGRAKDLGVEVMLYDQPAEKMALSRRYNTILVPSSTFQLVHDLAKAKAALAAFYQHLLPGGVLVMSIWRIKRGWTGEWRDWWLVAEKEEFDGDLGIRRWERSMHDPETQLRHTENRYELVRDEEVVYAELHRQSPEFRNYTLDGITGMVKSTGFEKVWAVSEFSSDPATDDDEVFCVLAERG